MTNLLQSYHGQFAESLQKISGYNQSDEFLAFAKYQIRAAAQRGVASSPAFGQLAGESIRAEIDSNLSASRIW